MVTVATPAVRGERGAVLRREAVVAVKKSFYAILREIVFRVHAFGGMAAPADVLGNFEIGCRFESLNFVLGMTIRARGCITFSGRDGFAVNAGLHIACFLEMTGAARFGLAREVKRRGGRTGSQYFVGVVTILAGGGIRLPGFVRETVDAGAIALSLALMA